MDRELRVVLSARVFSDQKCFGPGVSQLLKRVDELHSLRAAALSMSMAYSKAWTVVRNAEDGLGFHLLTSTAGGKHGGELRAIVYDANPDMLRAVARERIEELESIERYKAEQKQKEEERRAKRKKLFSGILGRDEDDGKPPKNRPPEF